MMKSRSLHHVLYWCLVLIRGCNFAQLSHLVPEFLHNSWLCTVQPCCAVAVIYGLFLIPNFFILARGSLFLNLMLPSLYLMSPEVPRGDWHHWRVPPVLQPGCCSWSCRAVSQPLPLSYLPWHLPVPWFLFSHFLPILSNAVLYFAVHRLFAKLKWGLWGFLGVGTCGFCCLRCWALRSLEPGCRSAREGERLKPTEVAELLNSTIQGWSTLFSFSSCAQQDNHSCSQVSGYKSTTMFLRYCFFVYCEQPLERFGKVHSSPRVFACA